MDKELTFYPETERTRDLIYSEYSSCDRSIHLLIQEHTGVPYDLLLKAYRETISAYLSSADILVPTDFLEQLVARFEVIGKEGRVAAERWKEPGIHVVLRCVNAAYVLTTRERDAYLCAHGRMVPLTQTESGGVERIRLATGGAQAELFPQTLCDVVTVFKLGPAQMTGRDLVLGCAEGETETVLEGLCGPAWSDSENEGDVRALRRSIVSRFVSHRILVVRFGDLALTRDVGAAVTGERLPGRKRWVPGRKGVVLGIAAILVTVLITVLWRREYADREQATTTQLSHPRDSAQGDKDAAALSSGRSGPTGDERERFRLREKWRQRYESEVTSSPVVLGETVVFGCRDGAAYALRRDTGAQRWKFVATAGIGSSPVVWRDRVIIADYNGNVFALDGRTGERSWSKKLPMKIVGSPDVLENRVMMGCYDGRAYCLSTEDGRILWTVKTGAKIRGFAAASDGKFFVPSYDGFLYALSAATGSVVWRRGLGGPVAGSPAIGGAMVVIGAPDGRVHCLDAAAGATRWTFSAGGAIESRPCIMGDSVVIGSNDGYLYCLDLAAGGLVWKTGTGQAVLGRPLVTNGIVYAGSYDGRLYAIDASSGSVIDVFEAGGPVYSSPVMDENNVYFGTNRGEFICVEYRRAGTT